MPALEMAQGTGKLLSWRKQEGDRVSKGDPLLEIETDKAVIEAGAPADGVLAGIHAFEGAEIPVGQAIAWIVVPGELPPADGATSCPAPTAGAGSHAKTESAAHSAKTSPIPTAAQQPVRGHRMIIARTSLRKLSAHSGFASLTPISSLRWFRAF